jgi:hypothetical protein
MSIFRLARVLQPRSAPNLMSSPKLILILVAGDLLSEGAYADWARRWVASRRLFENKRWVFSARKTNEEKQEGT